MRTIDSKKFKRFTIQKPFVRAVVFCSGVKTPITVKEFYFKNENQMIRKKKGYADKVDSKFATTFGTLAVFCKSTDTTRRPT